MSTQPIVPPGGNFPTPATSSSPLLALRCGPAVKPYLVSDVQAGTQGGILIDAPVTFSQIANAVPITLSSHPSSQKLDVTIAVSGHGTIAHASVPLNASKFEIPFSLASLKASTTPLDVTCSATLGHQTFTTSSKLPFLPDNTNGSVTKMDMKTGALLARPATGEDGPFEPVFPIGFYTSFGGFLENNLTTLDDIKAKGYTVVHPIPTFDNLTAFDLVVTRMQELGLYLMYDMRWTYTNLTGVTEEVNRIKNRPNLLLWYTGDEPDGWEDPLNGTQLAYDTIYGLDSGYHPVSLVLNCQDYFFEQYSAGADIVMQDVYMVGNNVTFSSQWGTVCTPDVCFLLIFTGLG
jgi:hypothetical protein